MCRERSSTWRHFVLIQTARNGAMRTGFRSSARGGSVPDVLHSFCFLCNSTPDAALALVLRDLDDLRSYKYSAYVFSNYAYLRC
jgi:hypothetical protein